MDTQWAEGIAARRFKKQLSKWSGQEEIDLILTAKAGFCDRFTNDHSLKVYSGEGALIRGLFRLLTELRKKATVVAIDWTKYEDVLF